MDKHDSCHKKGKVFVVGIGPGGAEHMTTLAVETIRGSECIVGYRTYLEQISEYISGREVISSEMMKEVERCRQAIELAVGGRRVALVCGGDPGIYAMAGLVFELAKKHNLSVSIEVIPGVAALNACAARLGAPLMHDFAAISLSDLLTPWELIERRLRAASEADFVIVLYNPRSKRRTEQLLKARDILLEFRSASTPVGVVTGATRQNERIEVNSLENLADCAIDMQSTVIVGNSQSFVWDGFMITPRGYCNKYSL